ncbi:MAG: toxin-antitoxin system YwqK family antitoxin, partial [Phycisphaerae bacterium]
MKWFLVVVVFLPVAISAQVQDFRDYYPNGALRSEGRYRDGFEDSLWHYYYETGAIQERTNYRRGKLHGQVLRYHPNGQLMVEGYFIRDQQD